MLRLTGKRDRLIGCVEKESILGKDISTCLPVSLNRNQVSKPKKVKVPRDGYS